MRILLDGCWQSHAHIWILLESESRQWSDISVIFIIPAIPKDEFWSSFYFDYLQWGSQKELASSLLCSFFSLSPFLSLFLAALSDELCCIELCQGLLVQYLIWRKREKRRKIALNLEMQPRERENGNSRTSGNEESREPLSLSFFLSFFSFCVRVTQS